MVDTTTVAQRPGVCPPWGAEADELALLVDCMLREEIQRSDLDPATRQRLLAAPLRLATVDLVVRTLRRLHA